MIGLAGPAVLAMSASGAPVLDGSASLRVLRALVASGSAVLDGAAAVALRRALAASGSLSPDGTATITALVRVSGSGAVALDGSADLIVGVPLIVALIGNAEAAPVLLTLQSQTTARLVVPPAPSASVRWAFGPLSVEG